MSTIVLAHGVLGFGDQLPGLLQAPARFTTSMLSLTISATKGTQSLSRRLTQSVRSRSAGTNWRKRF